jgi:hypothetical protein
MASMASIMKSIMNSENNIRKHRNNEMAYHGEGNGVSIEKQ